MSPIPLPASLDGVEIERVIRMDSALFYLVNGALSALLDRNRYEQTGTLTEADARVVLETMLEDYFAS